MTIKPIDAQVLLHSTPDIAKQQSVQNNKDENMQAQSSQTMQKKIEQDAKQVTSLQKADNAKINRKPEKDKQEEQSKKKRKENGQQSESTIDIRI